MAGSLFWKSDTSDSDSLHFKSQQIVANRFRLKEFLAEGGSGQVWKARDLCLHLEVALKISKDDLRKEAVILRILPKDHYMSIFDYIECSKIGVSAYSMELLLPPWMTLMSWRQEHLSKLFKVPAHSVKAVKFIILVALDTLDALRLLHGKKYTKTNRWCHGDIKPNNIYVNSNRLKKAHKVRWKDEIPKLIKIGDFGLACESGSFSNGGAPSYMAPEQKSSVGTVSTASDVFAMGQTIAYLITGSPFNENDLKRVNRMRRLINGAVPSSYLSGKLATILRKMTVSNQVQRPGVGEISRHLRSIAIDESDWIILEELAAPQYSNGILLSETAELFDSLAPVHGWTNRSEERLKLIQKKVKGMYRRGMLKLNGRRYHL